MAAVDVQAEGTVVVDVAALQSPTSRGRGIGRHTLEWALAVEAAAAELVGAYLLDPDLPPPGDIEALLATGKVAYRDGELGRHVRVVHTCSPFDLAVGLSTVWPRDGGLRRRRSATVYDLIPAKDPATYLADASDRQRYQVRLELVRAADQVHAISSGVAGDLHRLVGLAAGRVVTAGTAPSGRFRPARAGGGETGIDRARRSAVGVRRRYVLYPTGSHPRKNNEGLLRAFGLLPARLRQEVQLVLTGELPASTAHHLRHMANDRAFAESLVVTGAVDDDTLVALYRGADLVVFPSLAEGFGLPIAEALACGTPAIGSDMSPIDELLPPVARFDPSDDRSVASSLATGLASEDGRALLLAATAAPPTWAEVGRRSAEALATLAASPVRPQRRRARRVAVVTPLPPAETGVAAYSARLVGALAEQDKLQIDCFADGPTPASAAPEGAAGLFAVSSLEAVEAVRGGYDAVLYAMGNSHYHLGALDGLRRRAGIVLAHDVRLTNLYRHDVARPDGPPGGLPGALRRLYGDGLPAGLGAGDDVRPAELERFGLLMAREVIGASRRFLVSSEAAAALARAEARAADTGKVGWLPFAFAPWEPRAAAAGRNAPDGSDGAVIAHFGIVDPAKEPFTLLEAFALLQPSWPSARLRFVGPIAAELAGELRRRAAGLGLAGALEVTGAVDRARYEAALATTTVAVQLRAASNGEASAAVGECLAAGVPTVVTAIGWSRELPAAVAVQVRRAVPAGELAVVLDGLLADDQRRAGLARAGRDEAARRTFQATAAALLEHLALDGVARRGVGASAAG